MTTEAQRTFGRLLQQALDHSGMSRKAVGAELGVTDRAVGNWTRGEDVPELSRLAQLEALLGVKDNRLLVAAGYGSSPTEVVDKLDHLIETVDWLKGWAEGRD